MVTGSFVSLPPNMAASWLSWLPSPFSCSVVKAYRAHSGDTYSNYHCLEVEGGINDFRSPFHMYTSLSSGFLVLCTLQSLTHVIQVLELRSLT